MASQILRSFQGNRETIWRSKITSFKAAILELLCILICAADLPGIIVFLSMYLTYKDGGVICNRYFFFVLVAMFENIENGQQTGQYDSVQYESIGYLALNILFSR